MGVMSDRRCEGEGEAGAGLLTEALLTKMSTRPHLSTAACTHSPHLSALRRSSWKGSLREVHCSHCTSQLPFLSHLPAFPSPSLPSYSPFPASPPPIPFFPLSLSPPLLLSPPS